MQKRAHLNEENTQHYVTNPSRHRRSQRHALGHLLLRDLARISVHRAAALPPASQRRNMHSGKHSPYTHTHTHTHTRGDQDPGVDPNITRRSEVDRAAAQRPPHPCPHPCPYPHLHPHLTSHPPPSPSLVAAVCSSHQETWCPQVCHHKRRPPLVSDSAEPLPPELSEMVQQMWAHAGDERPALCDVLSLLKDIVV